MAGEVQNSTFVLFIRRMCFVSQIFCRLASRKHIGSLYASLKQSPTTKQHPQEKKMYD